jgi:hypothetical protein
MKNSLIGCPWLRKMTLSSIMDGTTLILGQLWHAQRGKWKTRTTGFVAEIMDHGFDMLCGLELGLNMDKLSADDKWPKHHYGTGLGMNKATFAYNTIKGSSTDTVLQLGGVWMVATKHVIPHM